MNTLSTLDILVLGSYLILLFQNIAFCGNTVISIALIIAIIHYIPCMYLLRKHGYLSGKFGVVETKEGRELFSALFVDPIKRFFNWVNKYRFSLISLSLTLFLILLLLVKINYLLENF